MANDRVSAGGELEAQARRGLPGWPLLVVAVGVQAATAVTGISLEQYLNATTHRSPGVGAWYFVQEHFVSGCCQAVGVVAMVTVGLAFWRRYRLMALMAMFMNWIFAAHDVVVAAVIALSTSHLFDPASSTSPWATYSDFSASPWISRLPWAVMLGSFAGFLLAVRGMRQATGARPHAVPTA